MYCRPVAWNIFLWRDFSCYTDYKSDCIVCNWFRNIWPRLLEVVCMAFNKELPCEYISCSVEWVDLLEMKVVVQLKGWMGLDSLESHWLKRSAGLDFTKSIQCHAIFHVKFCNALLGSLMKGAHGLILLGLRVSHKVPSARSWNMPSRQDL